MNVLKNTIAFCFSQVTLNQLPRHAFRKRAREGLNVFDKFYLSGLRTEVAYYTILRRPFFEVITFYLC